MLKNFNEALVHFEKALEKVIKIYELDQDNFKQRCYLCTIYFNMGTLHEELS